MSSKLVRYFGSVPRMAAVGIAVLTALAQTGVVHVPPDLWKILAALGLYGLPHVPAGAEGSGATTPEAN